MKGQTLYYQWWRRRLAWKVCDCSQPQILPLDLAICHKAVIAKTNVHETACRAQQLFPMQLRKRKVTPAVGRNALQVFGTIEWNEKKRKTYVVGIIDYFLPGPVLLELILHPQYGHLTRCALWVGGTSRHVVWILIDHAFDFLSAQAWNYALSWSIWPV